MPATTASLELGTGRIFPQRLRKATYLANTLILDFHSPER